MTVHHDEAVIRPMRLDDCETVGTLLREIWLDAYSGIQTDEELLTQSHKVHAPELLAHEIDDPNYHSVVAVIDGRIIGHARSDLYSDVVEVARLYILREFYGRGIGSALLREVDTHFSGDFAVKLEVYEDNERAVNFYLSHGYEIVTRTSEVQTEGNDVFEYVMRKITSP